MKNKSKQKEKEIRILKTGDEYDILKGFEINTSFPNKNFELKMTPKGRIYFKELPDYKSPEKIYSNDKDFMDHVKRTWNSMESGNLGVALVGGKGLGKSLTANELAHSLGIPVLRIKEPVLSMAQLEIINSIDSDCVLFLDESKIIGIKLLFLEYTFLFDANLVYLKEEIPHFPSTMFPKILLGYHQL